MYSSRNFWEGIRPLHFGQTRGVGEKLLSQLQEVYRIDLAALDLHAPPRHWRVVISKHRATYICSHDPRQKKRGERLAPQRTVYRGEIVGVVSDAKYRSLREPMTPTFYNVWTDDSGQPFQLEVRSRRRPELIIEPVRQALAALDPALPFVEIETMADEVEASAGGERLTAVLASIFSAIAALLAAIGIYGLLAYAVAQRHREIGIRMAVGARPIDIGEMIGLEALVMVSVGITVGLCAAAVSAPLIRSLLYGVAPSDPLSLALAALLVASVAAIATAIPTSRATRIEPASVLRQEN